MSGWILSVVSVVVLTVLLDLFMAEGQTKKYIKGIMSIIVIAVIIAPVPKLINKEINVEEVFNANEYQSIEEDEAYFYRLMIAKYSQKEKSIELYLKDHGLKDCRVRINIYQYNGEIEIINVLVSLEKAVITSNDKNININEMIYEAVNKVTGVSKEFVIIYGKKL